MLYTRLFIGWVLQGLNLDTEAERNQMTLHEEL